MQALTKKQCQVWKEIYPILVEKIDPLSIHEVVWHVRTTQSPGIRRILEDYLEVFLSHGLVAVQLVRNPPSRKYPDGYIRQRLWSLSARGRTKQGEPAMVAWNARWDRLLKAG